MSRADDKVDKQARTIFDELIKPVISMLQNQSQEEVTNLTEDLKKLKDQ